MPQIPDKMISFVKSHKNFIEHIEDFNKKYMSIKVNYNTIGFVEWG